MYGQDRNISVKNLALILLFFSTACTKFLDVDAPNSKIPSALVFADDITANAALAGMYSNMYYYGSNSFASGEATSFASLAGLSADELHNIGLRDLTVSDFETNKLQADNGHVANLWGSMYKTIYQANAIEDGIGMSTGLTQEKKDYFLGEALFIRAFCHFYLVNAFGDVPLVTITNYKVTSRLLRTPQLQVYDQIEADLLKAENLLPENYPTEARRVRPVKSVAIALLARLYLYKKDWLKAVSNATKIIDKTVVYKLENNLNNVFLSNSREAIWQLKPTGNSQYTNEGYTFSPNIALENNVLSDALVNSFQQTDLRKLNWVTSAGAIKLPYKYKLYQLTGQPSNEYSMVFRLAEQFFIRAEAKVWLGQISGLNSAESDINIIRYRAGLPDTIFSNINEATSIIELERRFELFTEWGHRWMDLKRWQRATSVLAPLKPAWTANDTIYPIPRDEINKNPFLTPQNAGYE